MSSHDEASLDRAILAAGLTPLGSVPSADGIDPPRAWSFVTHGDVKPNAVVDYHDLEEVERQWRRLAEDNGIFSQDDSFLLTVYGAYKLPWSLVRANPSSRLAPALTAYAGEPEFLTMARDGHALCSVTSEENGIWITCVDSRETDDLIPLRGV